MDQVNVRIIWWHLTPFKVFMSSNLLLLLDCTQKTIFFFQFAMSNAITSHKSSWNRWVEHESINENNNNDKMMCVCVCTWWRAVFHVENPSFPWSCQVLIVSGNSCQQNPFQFSVYWFEAFANGVNSCLHTITKCSITGIRSHIRKIMENKENV